MKRKLVAALACRAGGSRLYGKPLQNIDAKAGITILDHLIKLFKEHKEIDEIVLGISEGQENLPFIDVAKREGIGYILGDQKDVLQRLIQCGEHAGATDVFRITSECPFPETSVLSLAWKHHINEGNDVTVTDGVPEGTHFEIYTLDALKASHRLGGDEERSERCSLYVRRHLEDFKVEILDIPDEWKRLDLRLTVDYPEDLVVCRQIYAALKEPGTCRIPLSKIIPWLEANKAVHDLIEPYVVPKAIWQPQAPQPV